MNGSVELGWLWMVVVEMMLMEEVVNADNIQILNHQIRRMIHRTLSVSCKYNTLFVWAESLREGKEIMSVLSRGAESEKG